MKICPTCQRTYPDDFSLCPRDGTPLVTQATETEAQLSAGLSRRYRIVRRLGQGGMGAVFLAEQIAVGNRQVALKVLSRKLLDDPEFLLRFQNEAGSTGRIRHANVVTIFESGQADDGTPYIAMEFLEGESLGQALKRRGALPVTEVAEILQQAARGLNAAHKLGIIHRDLKPDNIFLTHPDDDVGAGLVPALPVGPADTGRPQEPPLRPVVVKVVDFGIAKLRESATHTMTGMVLGTPAYMSYEQASGMRSDELDARSDVYSLGVVVYETLAGRVPFHSDTPVGYLRKHLMEESPPFRAVAPGLGVPPAVESAVMKALVKDRDQRYASALDFARDFTRAASASSQAEVEQRERGKVAAELAAREKAERERLAREKAEAERRERERVAAEQAAREKAEQERLTREKAEAERREREKASAEQAAREKAEAERREKERAAAERAAWEKAEQDRLARAQAETDRIERVTAVAAQAAREKVERERLAWEKAEQDRLAGEKAEAERREKEKAEAEWAAASRTPTVPKPPQFQTVPEPSSKLKFVVIAVLALVLIVAAAWYFSPSPNPPVDNQQNESGPSQQRTEQQPPVAPTPPPPSPNPSESETDRARRLQQVEAAKMLGDNFYENGQYDNAIDAYLKAQQLDPSNAYLRQALQRAQTAKAAEAKFNNTNAAGRLQQVEAAKRQGDNYCDNGQYDNAINAYQAGLRLDPSNAQLRQALQRAQTAKAAEEKFNH